MKSFFQEFYQFRPEVLVEVIGTFILVFAGTGAVMVNNISQGAITHLGISFVFGAVVAALIYSLGHLSGAHFNPAVTLAFYTSGFFPKRQFYPLLKFSQNLPPFENDENFFCKQTLLSS